MVVSAWRCQRTALGSTGAYRFNHGVKDGSGGTDARGCISFQPSCTPSFKQWHVATKGAIHSRHALCVQNARCTHIAHIFAARAQHHCKGHRSVMQWLYLHKYIRDIRYKSKGWRHSHKCAHIHIYTQTDLKRPCCYPKVCFPLSRFVWAGRNPTAFKRCCTIWWFCSFTLVL